MMVDEIQVDEQHVHIYPAKMTKQGVGQTHPLNPYQLQQAETAAATEGIKFINTEKAGNMVATSGKAFVKHAMPGRSVICVRGVDFLKGSKSVVAHLKGKGSVEVRIDGLDSPTVAVLSSKADGWQRLKSSCRIKGVHDLFFTLSGDVQFDDWQFL